MGQLPPAHPLQRTEPATPGICPDRELSCDLLVHRLTLEWLSYASQASVRVFMSQTEGASANGNSHWMSLARNVKDVSSDVSFLTSPTWEGTQAPTQATPHTFITALGNHPVGGPPHPSFCPLVPCRAHEQWDLDEARIELQSLQRSTETRNLFFKEFPLLHKNILFLIRS
uniref:Uncharacterized protein n=1 Tax=Myotis myotis TaxID=51298 RepID=A0A7J7ZX08_MYOMY|nr:hypothetical protein mMyoMyo1_009582 [Myotis myotis]